MPGKPAAADGDSLVAVRSSLPGVTYLVSLTWCHSGPRCRQPSSDSTGRARLGQMQAPQSNQSTGLRSEGYGLQCDGNVPQCEANGLQCERLGFSLKGTGFSPYIKPPRAK